MRRDLRNRLVAGNEAGSPKFPGISCRARRGGDAKPNLPGWVRVSGSSRNWGASTDFNIIDRKTVKPVTYPSGAELEPNMTGVPANISRYAWQAADRYPARYGKLPPRLNISRPPVEIQ